MHRWLALAISQAANHPSHRSLVLAQHPCVLKAMFPEQIPWISWVKTTGIGMREKAGMALNPCFSKCYVTCVVEKIIGKYGLLPEIWILLKDFGGKIKEKNNQWVILMMENPQYILNFVNFKEFSWSQQTF